MQELIQQGGQVDVTKVRLFPPVFTDLTYTQVPEEGDPCWLHEAVDDSSAAVVELLLEAGADIHCNRYHDGGDTLLHYAVFRFARDEPEAVEKLKLLLKAGLDPNGPGLVGYTLLGYVLNSGQWTWVTVEVVKLLLDHGARTNTSDPSFQSSTSLGSSPLAFALNGKFYLQDEDINMEIVRLLITAGAAIEERTCHDNLPRPFCGPTPLYLSSVASYLSVVRLLVESGADIWFQYAPYWLADDVTPWYIWADWEFGSFLGHLPQNNTKKYLLKVCQERLVAEGKGEEVEGKCSGSPTQK
jgi:hypothetical protein